MVIPDQPSACKGLDPANHAAPPESPMAAEDQRLLTIFEVAKILVAESDLDSMLPKLLLCLIKTIESADAGALLLHNSSEGVLAVRAAQGYDSAILGQIRLAPGESMSGKVFQTGQAELYHTPEAVAEAMANMKPANREIFRAATIGLKQPLSAICVPLVTGQEKVGVLVLENLRQPGGFTRSDLAFLQAMADLIALSIENARLGQELYAHALDEANRLKAELISTLAHELRTPLTSIKGFSTALLMDEVTFSPETQREFLQMVDEECDILQDLIHDLLESSIIDAGFLRLEPQPVMLPRLVQSVIGDIAHRSQKHHLLIDFPEGFPIVDADPDRVAQVLRNLLDNAIKYSPEGGIVVVRGEVGDGEVVVSVADQGIGIAPEHLNRLFEKFFRVKSGLGRRVAGSGLGLPIAHTIVESHGGRIWAESQVGQGTTLHFALPLRGLSQEPEE
jgi:signal transduction histidine kinase